MPALSQLRQKTQGNFHGGITSMESIRSLPFLDASNLAWIVGWDCTTFWPGIAQPPQPQATFAWAFIGELIHSNTTSDSPCFKKRSVGPRRVCQRFRKEIRKRAALTTTNSTYFWYPSVQTKADPFLKSDAILRHLATPETAGLPSNLSRKQSLLFF